MKKNTLPKNNPNAAMYIAFGLWGSFLLGVIYAPSKLKYEKQSFVPSIQQETVFVEKVIQIPVVNKEVVIPKEEKVVEEDKVVEDNEPKRVINEDDYNIRMSYGYTIRHMDETELRKFLTINGLEILKMQIYTR
jgi:hypothetical protein